MADMSTPDARPDLFAGATARDDSYRILARLAHGGAVPEPSVRLDIGGLRNSRAAVAVALIAVAGAAWLLAQGGSQPAQGSAQASEQPGARQAAPASGPASATASATAAALAAARAPAGSGPGPGPSRSLGTNPGPARSAAVVGSHATAWPPATSAAGEPLAASIVNEPERPATSPPVAQAASAPTGKAAPAPARAPATVAGARKPTKPTAESDEDVTLLTAMLKHAGKQKTPPTRPAEE